MRIHQMAFPSPDLTWFSQGTTEQVPRLPYYRPHWRLGKVRMHLQIARMQQCQVGAQSQLWQPLALQGCRKQAAGSFAISTSTRPSGSPPVSRCPPCRLLSRQRVSTGQNEISSHRLRRTSVPSAAQAPSRPSQLLQPVQEDRKAAARGCVWREPGCPLDLGTVCPDTRRPRDVSLIIQWCVFLLCISTERLCRFDFPT